MRKVPSDCTAQNVDKTSNANVDIGYRSAIAAHMANIAYRQKQRVTLEIAKAAAQYM